MAAAFCVAARDPERAGDVVSDVARSKGDRAQSDQHPAVVNGNVGGVSAQFDQRDPEIAFLVAEACQRGRDW